MKGVKGERYRIRHIGRARETEEKKNLLGREKKGVQVSEKRKRQTPPLLVALQTNLASLAHHGVHVRPTYRGQNDFSENLSNTKPISCWSRNSQEIGLHID